MATVKGLFSTAITRGMAAAEKITDNNQRALAYAALADAMAKTGLISGTNLDDGEVVTTPAEVKGKEALKPETGKNKPVPEKKLTPKPEEKPVEEPELTEEWTDEAAEKKAEQIEFVQGLKAEYEEATLNNCVEQFSEGVMKTLDEITPLNIDAFVEFMKGLIAQQESAQ
jgi:hypothetical protein